jgi:hypothetical protein
MAHDAFISYSHVDKATADAACATLEKAGIRCWIAPRDITPGVEWGAAIVNAIDNSRVIVVIFSSSANGSPQIRREVERAINAGVPVVPVRIENVVPTESLAYFMSAVHWLDAITPPLEQHLQRLADSIKGLLQLGPAAAQTAALTGGVSPTPQPAIAGLAPAASPTPPAKVSIRTMFAEIMNFNYRRNWLQAIAWYLTFLVIGVALSAVAGKLIGINTTSFAEGYELGVKVGQIFIVFYCLALAVLLLWGRPKNGVNILLAVAGVVLSALLFGALTGLITLAILTTRPPSK